MENTLYRLRGAGTFPSNPVADPERRLSRDSGVLSAYPDGHPKCFPRNSAIGLTRPAMLYGRHFEYLFKNDRSIRI